MRCDGDVLVCLVIVMMLDHIPALASFWNRPDRGGTKLSEGGILGRKGMAGCKKQCLCHMARRDEPLL